MKLNFDIYHQGGEESRSVKRSAPGAEWSKIFENGSGSGLYPGFSDGDRQRLTGTGNMKISLDFQKYTVKTVYSKDCIFNVYFSKVHSKEVHLIYSKQILLHGVKFRCLRGVIIPEKDNRAAKARAKKLGIFDEI